MQRCLPTLLVLLFSHISHAQPLTHEDFQFPKQYTAEIHTQSRINEGQTTKQIQRITTDPSWIRIDIYLVIEGVGESLQQARFASHTETLILSPSSQQVSRSDRFKQTQSDAGEINLTPMPIIRHLTSLDKPPPRQQSTEGTTTITIPNLKIAATGNAHITFKDNQIIEYREAPLRDNQWTTIIRYNNWTKLPSGNLIPTSIQTETKISEDQTLFSEATLISYKETNHTLQDRSIQIPHDFTIIDHIEGVSKTSNGEVIAPINYNNQSHPITSTQNNTLLSTNNLIIGLGITTIIGAALLIRHQSRQRG